MEWTRILAYITGLRIDDAQQGREMLRRLIPHIATSDHWWEPKLGAWRGILSLKPGVRLEWRGQDGQDETQ